MNFYFNKNDKNYYNGSDLVCRKKQNVYTILKFLLTFYTFKLRTQFFKFPQ